MTVVVRSFRYPVERLGDVQVAEMLDGLPPGVRLVYHVEVEAATYPEAVRLVAEARRYTISAGLPELAWQGGSDVCPGCGRPEEATGSPEDEGDGSLF